MISFATIDVNEDTFCFVLNIILSIKFINLIENFTFFSVIFLFYSPFFRSSRAKKPQRKKREMFGSHIRCAPCDLLKFLSLDVDQIHLFLIHCIYCQYLLI
jgi:hypothetical protein